MKEYVKPDLYYEEFVLATHIAACTFKFNLTEGACSASSDFDNIFGSFAICDTEVGEDDGYCITNATSGFNTFAS